MFHLLFKVRRGCTSEKTNKIIDGHLTPTIVNLCVFVIDIQAMVVMVINGGRKGIASIAGHVVGQHQDYMVVGYSQSFNYVVHREDIGNMSVIKPKRRGANEYCPIICVCCRRGHALIIINITQCNTKRTSDHPPANGGDAVNINWPARHSWSIYHAYIEAVWNMC